MIFIQIRSVVLGIQHLEVAFIMSYFITRPRVTPLYYHYSIEPSIFDAFDNSHVQYVCDTLHIIKSLFNPQFIHYTKNAKYAFLLLFSIHINDTSFELSFFWQYDTESRINELRYSDSVSLSFKTRLTSVTCFAATLHKSK